MPRIRVLVVDDAVVMRKLISETLAKDAGLEVVGAAANGRIALQKIPQLNPDLLTLDLEMPEMDGLETLREVRKLYPSLPVIIFSTLSQRGAAATLDALSRGANDYVTKPANVGSVTEAMQRLESELIPKIKVHCRQLSPAPTDAPVNRPAPRQPRAAWQATKIDLVCIGTSTGGPNALAEVFSQLPAHLPTPIVMVQHMPPMFTAMLAERLTAHSPLPCHEGADGQVIECGHAYIAPGGRHMEVQRAGARLVVRLHDGTPENSCRPAVDVLFRSVAAAYGNAALGVVMTGMGQDGLRGSEALLERRSRVIAQDEASSVVWGMPGAVAQAGYADKILPLNRIAAEIVRTVQIGRRAA
ncbi:MAG TPA: chemotaxis response regulator protein-glutamate methylesterase [Verrucomicrobiae bacterium]|jgi:two-component system chemotaxis response regulator CheB|nr:chemotaxis response regulator protein-glutamate methylesterase [Verrucomicrobiae bacterium]